MTKILKTGNRNSPGKRSFRRWVRQLFVTVVKCRDEEMEEVLARLQDIQSSIEIIAREIARQTKQGK